MEALSTLWYSSVFEIEVQKMCTLGFICLIECNFTDTGGKLIAR